MGVYSQRRSISILETESEVLQTHIASARSGDTNGAGEAEETATAKAGSREKKATIQWKQLAAQMDGLNRGGTGDMRAMIRLQSQLQEMSRDELVQGLEEIAALDLAEQERAMLEQMLLGPLVEKDPEFALTKFVARLGQGSGGLGWQLSNAMQGWAKKDPAAATAWLDRQIADGTFDSKALDGRAPERIQFEGSLVTVLLGSDPQAAAARLAALPEDQRREVLLGSHREIPDTEQAAFASLVRSQIPADQQTGTLAEQASRFSGDDSYQKVTGFLSRIDPTPAERAACVEQAGESQIRQLAWKKEVTATELDAMRTWAAAEAPDSLDRATGKALVAAIQGGKDGKTKFADAAALAVHYNEASGNDEVLATFLESWEARRNKDEARELAAKISDSERREKILEQLK